jgi:hypothetical protein
MERGGNMQRWIRRMLLLGSILLPPYTIAAECGIDGDGGDAMLNRLKNRIAVPPPTTYLEMTVPQFMRQHEADMETSPICHGREK